MDSKNTKSKENVSSDRATVRLDDSARSREFNVEERITKRRGAKGTSTTMVQDEKKG